MLPIALNPLIMRAVVVGKLVLCPFQDGYFVCLKDKPSTPGTGVMNWSRVYLLAEIFRNQSLHAYQRSVRRQPAYRRAVQERRTSPRTIGMGLACNSPNRDVGTTQRVLSAIHKG